MKTFLIASDFSEHARLTLQVAVQLSKQAKARLILFHALPIYLGTTTDPLTPYDPSLGDAYALTTTQFDAAKKRLDTLAEEVRKDGLNAEVKLDTGDVTESIRQYVGSNPVDLVIVGRSETATGWLAQLFGNEASDLVQALHVPVLTVPPEVSHFEVKKLVYATQLEFDERPVLKKTFAWAHLLGAEVQLLKVEVPFEPDLNADKDYLDEIQKAFPNEKFEVITRKAETIGEGVPQFAQRLKADLLVLSSHHRGFFDQLISPSKTRQILLQSPVPTLVFPLENE